jgi:hypothetical protein
MDLGKIPTGFSIGRRPIKYFYRHRQRSSREKREELDAGTGQAAEHETVGAFTAELRELGLLPEQPAGGEADGG